MKNVVLLVNAVFLSSLFMMPEVSAAGARRAVADGSFIQPALCANWTDARWQEEFSAMKAAGMHYLVLQWVASCRTVRRTGSVTVNKVTTYFPSSLPNAKMAPGIHGHDMVAACLRNAESAGIKVFIGIDQNDGEWYSGPMNHPKWLYGQMDLDNRICDELWSLYKNKYPDAFYGWYWSYEVYYTQIETRAQQNVLVHAMNMQLNDLKGVHESLPFMWCPSFLGCAVGTPQAYGAMWKNVLAGLHTDSTDIFCPQDGIGAGLLTLSNVASWFSALRQAVNTKPGLKMWSDVETFNLREGLLSASIGRVVSQMKLEQPCVDNYITFAYCHYYSPYIINPGFQKTYVDYVRTGSLDSSRPTAPTGLRVLIKADGNVALSWSPSSDNIGVCGYYVYRDGRIVFKNQVSKNTDGRTSNSPLTSFTDVSLRSNTNYTYRVRTYDFAGNVSAPSEAVTVNPGQIPYLPDLVSLGCPYTVSIPACNQPFAEKDTKLTDGVYADSTTIDDARWEGFHDTRQKPRNVIIDLGRAMPVQQFVADYLLYPKANVFIPARVAVLISTNGVQFREIADLPRPHLPSDTQAGAYKFRQTLSSPVIARYVDFRTVPSARSMNESTFQDEFEVRSKVN